MDRELQALCDSFILNRDIIKSRFKMENSYIYPVCANIFTARGLIASEEELKRCRARLRERTGVFSNFRGVLAAPAVCMLASAPDPEIRLEQAIIYYDELKRQFFSSQYLALAAILLTELNVGARAGEHAARAGYIYRQMKKAHPMLTSREDSVFAVLLAFSEKQDDVLMRDAEECYGLLKRRFSSSNHVQTVSHVLALNQGASGEKAERFTALFDALRASGVRYGKGCELAALAAVSVQTEDIESAARDILSVDDFLSRQKGYGAFGIEKRTRLMHAAMLEGDRLCVPDGKSVPDITGQAAVSMTAAIALIAAQQAAMSAAVAASAT